MPRAAVILPAVLWSPALDAYVSGVEEGRAVFAADRDRAERYVSRAHARNVLDSLRRLGVRVPSDVVVEEVAAEPAVVFKSEDTLPSNLEPIGPAWHRAADGTMSPLAESDEVGAAWVQRRTAAAIAKARGVAFEEV